MSPRLLERLDRLSARLTEGHMMGLVFLGALLLYLPFAGSYGLWDPWETHYGEVARQMTERRDYISLWWPGSPRDQEVFWSKPALTFWILSLAMQVVGIGQPGAPAGEMALGARAEWAMRVPMCLAGALAVLAIYWLVARLVSRRAGLLSALVLATCPMFFLIARQAMTDMVFVGPMTMALCLAVMALYDDDTPLPRRQHATPFSSGPAWLRSVSWPAHRLFYLTLAVFLFVMVPQLIVDSVQLRVRIPWGNRQLTMYGVVVMIPYIVASIGFVLVATRARTRAPLYLYLAAILCGLAVLAKGLAGLGLPVIVLCVYLAATWNFGRMARPGLGWAIVVSVLLCVLVATPWHHTMIIRHGWAFWEELFGDNHWRRMVMGRHGDRGTFEYFFRELGFAIWPWLAVAPAAAVTLLWRARAAVEEPGRQRFGIHALGAVWLVAAYAVVSLSMTKFHHYILPAIPGLAILIGCALDRIWSAAAAPGPRTLRPGLLVALAGLPWLAYVAVDLVKTKHAAERFLWLFSYDYVHSPVGRPWPPELDFRTPLLVFAALFALCTLALAFRRAAGAAVAGLAIAALAFTFFLLDVYMPRVAPFWTQKDPIAAYYRARRSSAEPLVAYMMYWRGETFYTQNDIYEGPKEDRSVFDQDNADDELKIWVDRHRGRRVFFLYERTRLGRLQNLLPDASRPSFKVIHDHNNKFSVAHVDL